VTASHGPDPSGPGRDQPGSVDEPTEVVPVVGRGATTIADRVVEKIAVRAVSEVDAATGVARTILGVPIGSTDETSHARVDATVDGGLVSVRVTMSVTWPTSVRHVTTRVRDHVTGRIESLTALHVAEVDITVPTLRVAESRHSRVQ